MRRRKGPVSLTVDCCGLASLHSQQDVLVNPTNMIGIREVAREVCLKNRNAFFQTLVAIETEGGVVPSPGLVDQALQRTDALISKKFDRIER